MVSWWCWISPWKWAILYFSSCDKNNLLVTFVIQSLKKHIPECVIKSCETLSCTYFMKPPYDNLHQISYIEMAGAFKIQLKLLHRNGWSIRNSLSNDYLRLARAFQTQLQITEQERPVHSWRSTIIKKNCVLCKTFYCKRRWTTWKILSTDMNYIQLDTKQQRQFLNNTYIPTLLPDVQCPLHMPQCKFSLSWVSICTYNEYSMLDSLASKLLILKSV